MFLDWILREGWLLPTWWLLVTLAGVAAFPLCVRLLGGLPDKGYTLARATGMLLVGFVYWVLAIYGFIDNATGGMIFAWITVLIIGLLAYFNIGERINWREYWHENNKVIILAEILFITLFAIMFVYRAYQNDTFTTEKPMELNFISGIMRSESFPPNDPWMSGYSISYYYFGYVMTAMLTMLSGVNSGLGFSMMVALTFAMIGLTVFGVAYNLVRSRAFHRGGNRQENSPPVAYALITGVLATVFVLWMSNFQFPLVEMPYRTQSASVEYLEWWGQRGFTDVEAQGYQQTNSFPTVSTPFTEPNLWTRDWWWWHTSRVLEDYSITGGAQEIISEVPAFSFVLMDLHPHILALPFTALALGMAVNIVLLRRDPNRYEVILYGLMVGGLLFLNTWDGPVYFVILVGADALRRLLGRAGRLSLDDWLSIILFGAKIVGIAIIAYLPFLISFRSQAGGFIPNLIAPTPFRLYFLFFGPMLLLSSGLLLREVYIGIIQKRMNWGLGFAISGGILLFLVVLLMLFVAIGALVPEARTFVNQLVAQAGGWDAVLREIADRRLSAITLPIILLVGLALIVARLFPKTSSNDMSKEQPAVTYAPATGMALLLLAAAFGITLVPEFIYLRDNFGTRINTIFKFYYQAWLLFGIASSYAVYAVVFDRLPEYRNAIFARMTYAIGIVIILMMCLPYLVFGMYSRSAPQQNAVLSIDGRADGLPSGYLEAGQCLSDLVEGDDVVVVEAVNLTYNSAYGRLGAFYGLPTLINWEGHQRQWRGSTYNEVAGTRRQDVDRLYTELRWEQVIPIIDTYSIDYILFGSTERNQYGVTGEDKFLDNLTVVCEFGQTRVYATNSD